jgi:GNAT superfamily N-acetyltransferase
MPSVADYRRLRAASGLSPKSPAQAGAALLGTWFGVHVVDSADGVTVAMGRIVGDGGWYFQIADMAVLPDHQRRGLGARVLEALLAKIEEDAPPDPYVTLMADPPGRVLYARYGFVESAPHSIGMVRRQPAT